MEPVSVTAFDKEQRLELGKRAIHQCCSVGIAHLLRLNRMHPRALPRLPNQRRGTLAP